MNQVTNIGPQVINNIGPQVTMPIVFTRADGSQGIVYARVSPDVSEETKAALGRMAAAAEAQAMRWKPGDPKR